VPSLSFAGDFANFWPKCIWVPVETLLDGLLPGLLVGQVVEAVVAVAVVAELAVGEAVAVQLEALGLGAVARLARTNSLRFDRSGDSLLLP